MDGKAMEGDGIHRRIEPKEHAFTRGSEEIHQILTVDRWQRT